MSVGPTAVLDACVLVNFFGQDDGYEMVHIGE